jgi:hypothetical protein
MEWKLGSEHQRSMLNVQWEKKSGTHMIGRRLETP